MTKQQELDFQQIKLLILSIMLSLIMIGCKNDRYYTTTTEDKVYKIDKQTGRMWQIINGKEIIIENTMDKSYLVKRIAGAASTFAENGNSQKCKGGSIYHQQNENCLKNYIKQAKGIVSIDGWTVEDFNNGNYLALYKYSINNVLYYYPIEVNIELNRARELENMQMRTFYLPKVKKYTKQLHKLFKDKATYEKFITDLNDEELQKAIWENNVSKSEKISFQEYLKKLGIRTYEYQ